jgi:hypothetical protein
MPRRIRPTPTRSPFRFRGALTLPALAGAIALCAPAGAAGAVSPLPASDYAVHAACAAPAPGAAACLARELVPVTAAARAHTHPLGTTRTTPIAAGRASESAFGLRPADLHSAYQLPSTSSTPQTIALVDAYNDPSAEADLEAYDHEFGLPACTAANGCFEQVNQKGEAQHLPFPVDKKALEEREALCASKEGKWETACKRVEEAKEWAVEISLDVEVSHSICQSCKILLAEASTPAYANLEAAEDTAVSLGASEVSNSWGGEEPTFDAEAFNHPGIVITASAGDEGYLNWAAPSAVERGFADYPASSPHVVGVGGTRLARLSAGGAWSGETVWSAEWSGEGATGGGCSAQFPSQAWQTGVSDWSLVGCREKRAVADVSAEADPYPGVAIYDSQPGPTGLTWRSVGGTSVASPMIAATFALAGGAQGVPYPARTLYENEARSPGSLHDITSGSNGACSQPFNAAGTGCTPSEEAASCSSVGTLICLAGSGYDGPSGIGTPDGIGAFEPASQAGHMSEGGATGGGQASTSAPGGTAGGGGGQSGARGASASGASAPAASAAGASPILVPVLSGLSLTRRAIAALRGAKPRVSAVAFSFALNVAARVRVVLSRRVRVRAGRHWRRGWATLPGSLTIAAASGPDHGRLRARGALRPGTYRLTLTPAGGVARSLAFRVG